ncbi:MAG: S-ribosylhomocysteine lyase [Clostridia bacterium]|nr:S-ribosylhomocysteine lyase [Clostridia bacterium]
MTKDAAAENGLKKIASFTVDHTVLGKGIYISREDGDCVTYDVRTVRPNCGVYPSTGAIHTTEHLVATYVRSSPLSDAVVYFGPMGCRTGYYLILRDSVSKSDAIELILSAFRFTASFEGDIPGASEKECGNWLDHDLAGAKREAESFLAAAEGWTEDRLTYPE